MNMKKILTALGFILFCLKMNATGVYENFTSVSSPKTSFYVVLYKEDSMHGQNMEQKEKNYKTAIVNDSVYQNENLENSCIRAGNNSVLYNSLKNNPIHNSEISDSHGDRLPAHVVFRINPFSVMVQTMNLQLEVATSQKTSISLTYSYTYWPGLGDFFSTSYIGNWIKLDFRYYYVKTFQGGYTGPFFGYYSVAVNNVEPTGYGIGWLFGGQTIVKKMHLAIDANIGFSFYESHGGEYAYPFTPGIVLRTGVSFGFAL